MSGQFLLLGRGNSYYSDMLRWKRLPSSGLKQDLQARVLRYVKRVAMNGLRRRRKLRTKALLVLLRLLPTGPVSAVADFLRSERSEEDYQRTFMYVFGRQRVLKSFVAVLRGPAAQRSKVLIVDQGVDSDGDGIRGYVTLLDISTGEIRNRVDVDDISLLEDSAAEWKENEDMLYYASAASNAYDERMFLKSELEFLECEETLLAQVCETMVARKK